MNQNNIDKINAGLYEDGKITWDAMNGNWTNKVWQNLSKQGASSTQATTGYIRVYGPDKVQMGLWQDRVKMLAGVAHLMR